MRTRHFVLGATGTPALPSAGPAWMVAPYEVEQDWYFNVPMGKRYHAVTTVKDSRFSLRSELWERGIL